MLIFKGVSTWNLQARPLSLAVCESDLKRSKNPILPQHQTWEAQRIKCGEIMGFSDIQFLNHKIDATNFHCHVRKEIPNTNFRPTSMKKMSRDTQSHWPSVPCWIVNAKSLHPSIQLV